VRRKAEMRRQRAASRTLAMCILRSTVYGTSSRSRQVLEGSGAVEERRNDAFL
jgi:hypothetical protein